GSGEMRIARLATETAGSASEDDRAAPKRNQASRGLAADQKAAKTTDAPELLELVRAQLQEIDALIVASVEHHKVSRITSIARCHRPVKQTNDVCLAGRVDLDRFGAAALLIDRVGHLRNLLGRSTGDQHMIALGGKTAAERSAKAALGADT